MNTLSRTAWVGLRAVLVLTLVSGVLYTLLITAIGQLALPYQANGSRMSTEDGELVGSTIIGQNFTDDNGDPLPQYFQNRPSAAGDGYDPTSSSGTNAGPENEDLIAAITERKQAIADFNGVEPTEVPADAVTASSSGLEPYISLEFAQIQVRRVAAERGVSESRIQELIEDATKPADLGYLGERVVNVNLLNLALDELEN